MSYQFEDESALEELLNQQLDRQRQRQRTGIAQSSSRPSSSKPAIPSLASSQPQLKRPTTGIPNQRGDVVYQQEQTVSSNSNAQVQSASNQPARGKLASWLSNNSKTTFKQTDDSVDIKNDIVEIAPPIPLEIKQQTTARSSLRPTNERLRDNVIDETLREERLQELSKQGLIQLILTQVVPILSDLRSESASPRELERLRKAIEEEQVKTESLVERHSRELSENQSRWQQVQRQLEERIEVQESELSKTNERHKVYLSELENEHREQLNKLSENFQSRLSEEREQFEKIVKRREEYHQLELESKLKVNCDLQRLDAIFSEWQRMIESTIRALECQFKTVSGLLDKQTLEINGSNLELAKKSRQLSEQYDRFEEKGEQLGRLAEQLNVLLPQFSIFQANNETVVKQTSAQLNELVRRNDELRARELELNQLKESLESQREELQREHFQLGLDTNRLTYKEQRVGELISWNEQTETRLEEQRKAQVERSMQLDAMRTSLELQSKEAKEENHELHLRRRRLIESEEELRLAQVNLERERKSLNDKQVAHERQSIKLDELRKQSERELTQLRRLQKSLVCSLCLNRLFPDEQSSIGGQLNKWPANRSQVMMTTLPPNGSVHQRRQYLRSHSKQQTKGENLNDDQQDKDEELIRLSRQSQLDNRQLKAESKYVELLSVS